jgi:creatinine amidohydrolase/Fe(II)-dependent formamide hydrolase-like protein
MQIVYSEAHRRHATDNVKVEATCLEAARRAPREMPVMPLAAYGLDEHHTAD